ncbi:MAG: peptide deformylase [Candidatus Sungbacteria bacterium]|nr:peptide deformylase [Candidatus Sungbacteria bacterium]
MAIVKEPDRVLRKKAAEVALADIKSSRIQKLLAAMRETLSETQDGVGLAAPQAGESLRIFIVSEEAEEIDRAEKAGWQRRKRKTPEKKEQEPYEKRAWKYYVFINPVVKKVSRKMLEDAEGCLSVPQKYGIVMRHEKITVEAYNECAKKIIRGSSRFFARVMQHELDHLEGTLFIDKVKQFIEAEKPGKN